MTIATTIMNGSNRYYPCPLCKNQHPSTTTCLDVIGSKALMGWFGKMGTKKLDIFAKHVKKFSPEIWENAGALSVEEWRRLEEDETNDDFWLSPQKKSRQATETGTTVHAAIEMFIIGKQVDKRALSEPAQQAFGVFEQFALSHKLDTISTERTFYNCKFGIAGTADWSGKLDGKLTLADWKSSASLNEKGIVQCWANAIADEMSEGKNLYEQILIGRFGKDGSTDLLIVPRMGFEGGFGGYEESRVLIQACVAWFHYKQKFEGKFPYKKKSGALSSLKR